LPAAVEVAAYRIVQEALTNVVRHAQAHTCEVRLTLSRAQAREARAVLDVEITDDGVGLPVRGRAGVGLASIRERIAELGGTFHIASTPGSGTRIYARLPLHGAAVRADVEAVAEGVTQEAGQEEVWSPSAS
jgi:signal transduction histidine kinase